MPNWIKKQKVKISKRSLVTQIEAFEPHNVAVSEMSDEERPTWVFNNFYIENWAVLNRQLQKWYFQSTPTVSANIKKSLFNLTMK